MITVHSTSRLLRNIGRAGTLLLTAVSLTACGNSPQSMLGGTAPSALGTVGAAQSASRKLGTLKDHGNGNGDGKPTAPAPTAPSTGTTPGSDGDHGNLNEPQMQVEGIATSVTGTCPALTIIINGQTITTDLSTEFERADCTDIITGQRLHIAAMVAAAPPAPTTGTATTDTGTTGTGTTGTGTTGTGTTGTGTSATTPPTTTLLAAYVRLQGPKPSDGSSDDTGDVTTPPTTTTPTTTTTP
jgi:hypothetical protein